MSLTTDRNHPGLNKPTASGQNEAYIILSDDERAEGFIRPVRREYIHVGRNVAAHYKGIHRMLDDAEKAQYADKKYVAVMTVLTNEDGSFRGGTYVTQEELNAYNNGTRVGGINVYTIDCIGFLTIITWPNNQWWKARIQFIPINY